MPDESQIRTMDLEWQDDRPEGTRHIPARLHWPNQVVPGQSLPLVVFSHGLGGSREGYSYLGKYWAAHGIASLHVQHEGSDRSVWGGPPLELVDRLKQAARSSEALNRALDVQLAISRSLDGRSLPIQVDTSRIAVAGHSYGANTTLLIAGAQPPTPNSAPALRDPRVRATIIISAPPFYGSDDLGPILQTAKVPALHITSTGDEITVPGYHSGPQDRLRVFEAYGSPDKSLLVFKGGSHSMFTDRLNTGGSELNPQVKIATREATLEFLRRSLQLTFSPENDSWSSRHRGIVDEVRNFHNAIPKS